MESFLVINITIASETGVLDRSSVNVPDNFDCPSTVDTVKINNIVRYLSIHKMQK